MTLENNSWVYNNEGNDWLENDIMVFYSKEFNSLKESITPPEISDYQNKKSNVELNITKADDARKKFELTMNTQQTKSHYLQWEMNVKELLANQLTSIVELRNCFIDYCKKQKEQLNSQFRYIKKELIPNTVDWTKKQQYESILNTLVFIQDIVQDVLTDWSESYKDARDLIENKNYTLKYLLIKNDPYDRYSKDDRNKAKDKMEHWTPRSTTNSLQYLWWWPIDKKDYNTCWITNQTIINNERIIKDIYKNAQERSSWRKNDVLRRDQKNTIIQIPDYSKEMVQIGSLIDNILLDMQSMSIDATRLNEN